MVYYYDQGLVKKLETRFPSLLVINCLGEQLVEKVEGITVKENKKSKYPCIRVRRIPKNWLSKSPDSSSRVHKQVLKVQGLDFKERGISIDIEYEIEVISTDIKTAEDLLTSLMFFILDKPNVEVEFGEGNKRICPLIIKDIEEVTELSDFSDKGELRRYIVLCGMDNVSLVKQEEVKLILTSDVKFDIIGGNE